MGAETQDLAAVGNGHEAQPRPVPERLRKLRKRREEIAAKRTLTLKVPGYDGLVGVRYKAVPSDDFERFAERAARTAGKGDYLAANADLLIQSCQAILCRDTEDSDWEPLDENSSEPTTFSTGTLPELLGIEATSAREEVFGLFSPDGAQPAACTAHADAISDWLRGSVEEIDRDLLGE